MFAVGVDLNNLPWLLWNCRTDSTATRRVCSAHAVLSREPCWVFSLGSNGQTDFEEAIRSRYSHCKIHVYDPTISEEVAAKVAEVTQVLPHASSLSCPSHWRDQLGIRGPSPGHCP